MLIDNLEDKRRYTEGVVQEIFEKDIRHRVKVRNREGFETIRPKYVLTTDYLLQKRNGIRHINLIDFMKAGKSF